MLCDCFTCHMHNVKFYLFSWRWVVKIKIQIQIENTQSQPVVVMKTKCSFVVRAKINFHFVREWFIAPLYDLTVMIQRDLWDTNAVFLWQESLLQCMMHAFQIAWMWAHKVAVCIFSNSHQGLIALVCLATWCSGAPPVHQTYKIMLACTAKSWPLLAS